MSVASYLQRAVFCPQPIPMPAKKQPDVLARIVKRAKMIHAAKPSGTWANAMKLAAAEEKRRARR